MKLYITFNYKVKNMAEREGFEPSKDVICPYSLSRGALSTTQPSLQVDLSEDYTMTFLRN